MKILATLITCLLFITGCNQETSPDFSPTTKTSLIELSSGVKIPLKGTHVKSYEKANSKGILKIHVFSYSSLDKVAENDLYAALKSDGYRRNIIANDATKFKVHYYKKHFPTIGAIFTAENDSSMQKTTAEIYWQE